MLKRLYANTKQLTRKPGPEEIVSGVTEQDVDVVDSSSLSQLAQVSGRPDTCTPEQRRYYEDAERSMDYQWQQTIWPLISSLDFSVVVDLAAGYGRNSAKLLKHAKRLYVVDINQECIDYCKERFHANQNVTCIKTDGASLKGIESGTVTLVYSFDSMVHFDSDIVRRYLQEFSRILKPGGSCFCHHSNYTGQPEGDIDHSPHRRNFMSKELFAHYSIKAGLRVVRQNVLDWGGMSALDCFSLLERPLK